MFAFLKLLLAVVVGLILLLVIGFYLAKRWIKKWWSGIMEQVQQEMASGVPPFRIRLHRDEDDELSDSQNAEQIDESTDQLLGLGFTRIGDFHAPDCFLGMRAFQHHEHHMYAVLYDHVTVGVWCDLFRRYEDKTGWTYVNKGDDLSDRPPWSNTKFFPETTLEKILEMFLKETPMTGILKAGADKFVKHFEASYAREMNWRISRGGPSEGEIRRIAEQQGIEDVDAEHIAMIQQPWKDAISTFLSERMLDNWRTKTGQSEEEFETKVHRMLGVHKRMTPRKILAAIDDEYWEGAEAIDSDEEEDAIDPETKKWKRYLDMIQRGCDEGSAVAVFHAFLKKRNKTSEFELLGTVDRPIKGEIWLGPAGEYDHEETEHEGIDIADFDDIDTDD